VIAEVFVKLFLLFWVFAFAVPVFGNSSVLCGKITSSVGTHFFVKFRGDLDRLKHQYPDRYKDVDKQLQDLQEEKCEMANGPKDLKDIVEESLRVCKSGCNQVSKFQFKQARFYKDDNIKEMTGECSSICSKVYEDQKIFLSGSDLGFELSKTCAPNGKPVDETLKSRSNKAMQ
jgi:hypothetical protein